MGGVGMLYIPVQLRVRMGMYKMRQRERKEVKQRRAVAASGFQTRFSQTHFMWTNM